MLANFQSPQFFIDQVSFYWLGRTQRQTVSIKYALQTFKKHYIGTSTYWYDFHEVF